MKNNTLTKELAKHRWFLGGSFIYKSEGNITFPTVLSVSGSSL